MSWKLPKITSTCICGVIYFVLEHLTSANSVDLTLTQQLQNMSGHLLCRIMLWDDPFMYRCLWPNETKQVRSHLSNVGVKGLEDTAKPKLGLDIFTPTWCQLSSGCRPGWCSKLEDSVCSFSKTSKRDYWNNLLARWSWLWYPVTFFFLFFRRYRPSGWCDGWQ